MGVFDEPKVDCHVHVFDPKVYPYGQDTFYAPAGQEVGRPDQFLAVMDAYGVRQALLVGPNSGYDGDNSLLLDLLAREPDRLRGMAVVPNRVSRAELADLAEAGVIGATMNVGLFGPGFYQDAQDLVRHLAELDLVLDLQVTGGQLLEVHPLLEGSGVRMVVDHCGRPDPAAGLDQPGFRALLRLADRGGVVVKLSSLVKCSQESYPYRDAWPYVHALLDAFGPDACVWGSDWPFLRAPERIDYGPLVTLFQHLIPDPDDRRRVLWDTPRRLLGISQDPQP